MKRFLLPVLAAAIVLGGCSKKEEAEPKPEVEVKLAPATVEDVEQSITGPATVFPVAQAGVAARNSAPIQRLLVRKGDNVAAGQTLAVLESRDVTAAKNEAAANVTEAEQNLQKTTAGTLPSDLERARGQMVAAEAAYKQADAIHGRRKSLFDEGAIPQRDLLVAETDLATTKANYEVAKLSYDLLKNQSNERDIRIAKSHVEQSQARLAQADALLSYTHITAPFAGTITEQFMFPGDMARPDAPVFTVSDLSKAVARTQIPESDSAPIHAGQACEFLPGGSAAGSGEDKAARYAGKVTVVNRSADPARRTIEIWCEIEKPPAALHPGVFGDVAIVTERTKGVTVPRQAMQFNEGTHTGWVMVVEGGVAHKREVEADSAQGPRVHILKGLKGGESVVTEGVYGLDDNVRVKLAGSQKEKGEGK
jgi:multidrug efflux pump subunit AcrA (membrane-fusion protein)